MKWLADGITGDPVRNLGVNIWLSGILVHNISDCLKTIQGGEHAFSPLLLYLHWLVAELATRQPCRTSNLALNAPIICSIRIKNICLSELISTSQHRYIFTFYQFYYILHNHIDNIRPSRDFNKEKGTTWIIALKLFCTVLNQSQMIKKGGKRQTIFESGKYRGLNIKIVSESNFSITTP